MAVSPLHLRACFDAESDILYSCIAETLQDMAVPPLHLRDCSDAESDIEQMRLAVEETPHIVQLHLAIPSPWNGKYSIPMILYEVVKKRHSNCLKYILEVGKNIIKDSLKNEVFIYAKQRKDENDMNMNVMEVLLQNGACPNCPPEEDPTYLSTDWLFLSIDNHFIDELQLLLEYGAVTEDCEVLSDGRLERLGEGRTSPLTHAIAHCNDLAIKLLLLHQASTQCYFDYYIHGYVELSVPHFILYNYHEPREAFRVIQIFHEFGGNLAFKDNYGYPYTNMVADFPADLIEDETIIDSIQSRPGLQHHAELLEPLQTLMSNPRSLLSLSRLAIHRSMGRQYWRHVNTLEIPRELKQYLQFDVPARQGSLL